MRALSRQVALAVCVLRRPRALAELPDDRFLWVAYLVPALPEVLGWVAVSVFDAAFAFWDSGIPQHMIGRPTPLGFRGSRLIVGLLRVGGQLLVLALFCGGMLRIFFKKRMTYVSLLNVVGYALVPWKLAATIAPLVLIAVTLANVDDPPQVVPYLFNHRGWTQSLPRLLEGAGWLWSMALLVYGLRHHPPANAEIAPIILTAEDEMP